MPDLIASRKTYLAVYAVLLVLTGLTTSVAFYDFGVFNPVAALTIALIKATLVVLFFMHLRHSGRLTWLVAGAAIFWLGILFVLLLSDYLTRSPALQWPDLGPRA